MKSTTIKTLCDNPKAKQPANESPDLVPSKSARRRAKKRQMQQAINLGNQALLSGVNHGIDDIHSKYIQAVFNPRAHASRIPTRFPVKSSLFRKTEIYNLVHDGISESMVMLLKPWEMYEPSATSSNRPAWFSYSNSQFSSGAWEYSFQNPMTGYFGGYGEEDARATSFRVVSTVMTIRYAGKVLDFSGMITAGMLAGNGIFINLSSEIPTASQLATLPYSYVETIKSDSEHQCVVLPIDPLDEIFTKPENPTDFEAPNQRNQIAVILSNLDSASAKFQVTIDVQYEYLPTGSFVPWTATRSVTQSPQTIDLLRDVATKLPVKSFSNELKPPQTNSKSSFLGIINKGLKEGLDVAERIPGTIGTIASGLKLAKQIYEEEYD